MLKFSPKLLLLILALCHIANAAIAQNYQKLSSFTTKENLPSNHVYDMVQDDNDFLWVATDNGVAKFDGKYFIRYSVKDGLPSNDVLQVLKEKNGTIWVNCYQQNPAYYDAIQNKFITIQGNPDLNKIAQKLLIAENETDGSVAFKSKIGSVSFKNRKIIDLSFQLLYYKINISGKNYYISFKINSALDLPRQVVFLCNQEKQPIDSFIFDKQMSFAKQFRAYNQVFSFQFNNSILRFVDFKLNPFNFHLESFIATHSINTIKFNDSLIYAISADGYVFEIDVKTFKLKHTIYTEAGANMVYLDHQNNLWVGTIDKGLQLYSNNGIKKIIPPIENGGNFLSICFNGKGRLFAGNYHGIIIEKDGNQFQTHNISSPKSTPWIRELLSTKNGIIAIHDNGYNVNFKQMRSLKNPVSFYSLKTGMNLNDTTVILGTTYGLVALNAATLKYRALNSLHERVLSLAKNNSNIFYFVQLNKLFKFDLTKNSSTEILFSNKNDSLKISTIISTSDSTLWVSTLNGSLLIFRKDKIISIINNSAGLPENIICMTSTKNKIWVGGTSGISIINYFFKNNQLQFSIENIGTADGLNAPTVNDFAIHNDSMYAATEKGIVIIPLNFKLGKFEIKPQLISIKINQINFPIDNSYQLQSNQNHITLSFAGVELNGHFKNLQYSIDDDLNWNDLPENVLNIDLNSGKHILSVRAIDKNNNINNAILKMFFSIATPFYNRIWFWVLIGILFSAIIFGLYYRKNLNQHRIKFEQQLALEMQRSKITADLHDDIGASLSSLQVNSMVASQLIIKDVAQAKIVLNKIENQSKDIAEKINDIIWSMKPGKDEFINLSSRIKNFASDMLGATDVDYKINIDKRLDNELNDITIRKNILLITKEAINNAAKYGNATSINVEIKLAIDIIKLMVTDNGIGFNIATINGNGIQNMKRRVSELNGEFSISSTINLGTTILVIIPFVPKFNDKK